MSVDETPIKLYSCTGAPIAVKGEVFLELAIPGLRKVYTWTFILADVSLPILGLDFHTYYGLLIDCKNHKLIDIDTNIQDSLEEASEPLLLELKFDIPVPPRLRPLFDNYRNLVRREPGVEKSPLPSHFIDTGSSPPTYARSRRLVGEKLTAAKEEINKLLKQGIIRPSKSSYSSPMHLVPKPLGGYRVTGDYRALNKSTKPDRYPVPHLYSFADRMEGKTVFSKIDLEKAFFHVPMNEADIPKTAMTTPFGLYEYLFMPMGLRNSSATFERVMDQIMKPCYDFCYWFVDDLLVASPDEQSHEQHLFKVFEVLEKFGLTISLSKSEFFLRDLEFLGHHVSAEGIKPSPSKVEAIVNFAKPVDYAGLRRYLGMIGFYRRMLPNFADKTFLLSEMLRLQANSKSLVWRDEEIAQFEDTKKMLTDAVCLPHLSTSDFPLHLVCDASAVAIGSGLHQLVDSAPRPIAFFSKKLSETQRRYSTFDRELCAAYESVLHFRDLIAGQRVILFTDHKPLAAAFEQKNPGKTDRQQRYWTTILEYVESVEYIRGSENVVADHLSRPQLNAITVDAFDFEAIAKHQLSDPEIDRVKDKLKTHHLASGTEILCDSALNVPRPYVPIAFRNRVFDELHNIAHPGVKSSQSLVKQRYFWPGMDKFIKEKVKHCVSCQQSKITRHTKSPLTSFSLPISARFAYVHIDIVGPLPPVAKQDGTYILQYRYLLTMIDRATRWVEAAPLIDITAPSVASAFLSSWISRFGIPLYICSDRGSQFESELFSCLATLLGFCRLRTAAYRPQSNGFIERVHRTLKHVLKARKDDWFASLPLALLGLRAQVHSDIGCSPFSFVTGSDVLVPPVIVDGHNPCDQIPDSQVYVRDLARRMKSIDFAKISLGSDHSSHVVHVPKDLQTCSHVWLRVDRILRSLEAPYQGPFLVKRRNAKTFLIEKHDGIVDNVSIDRLKPAYVIPVADTAESVNADTAESVNADTTESVNADTTESVNADTAESVDADTPDVDVPTYRTRSNRRVRFNPDPSYVYF